MLLVTQCACLASSPRRALPPIWTDGGFLVIGVWRTQITPLGAQRPPAHA
jgi:hypothetical protein